MSNEQVDQGSASKKKEEDAIREMNEVHVELGRKAARKAMDVLSSLSVDEIPVATAVSLLKFGIELERKALVGAEEGSDGADPFDALAASLAAGETPEKEE